MGYYQPRNQVATEAREDCQLMALALSQMWPVTATVKQEMVDNQLEILRHPLVPAAVKTLAARNLLACGVANLKAIQLMIDAGAQNTPRGEGDVLPATDEEVGTGLLALTNAAERVDVTPVSDANPRRDEGETDAPREWKVDAG